MSQKALELMIKKYEGYISNIEWHIKANKPAIPEQEKLDMRIDCYREALNDLKLLQNKKQLA